jgi:hypothetical protein
VKSRTLVLCAAALIVLMAIVAAAIAPAGAAPAPGRGWVGRSVALSPVNGHSMAPACPDLAQARRYTSANGKWQRESLGCLYMLPGNFRGAVVVDDAGDFVRVRFDLTRGAPPKPFPREDTFWTPRDRYRLTH